MKRTILLSIILLIGLLFIRAPSYAETGWLEAEGSSLSPLSGEARRFLEYEKIERMKESLGEEASGPESEASAAGTVIGQEDVPVVEDGVIGEEMNDGLTGMDGHAGLPPGDGLTDSPDAQDLKEAPAVQATTAAAATSTDSTPSAPPAPPAPPPAPEISL